MIGVLDASLAIPLILPIAGLAPVGQALASYELVAPELLALETTNAVWKYVRVGRLAKTDAKRALALFESLPIAYFADRPLAAAAFDLAAERNHPVYGCTYLALAIAQDGVVLTRDRRFAAALSLGDAARVRVVE